MAENTPTDIEALNQLAVRLRDTAETVRNPGVRGDIQAAADVASAMAHWRFVVAEIAAALPVGAFARNEIVALLGKPDIAAAKYSLHELAEHLRNKLREHRDGEIPFAELFGQICNVAGQLDVLAGR
jgi:hypothetical protein